MRRELTFLLFLQVVLVPLTFKSYEKHDELRGGARKSTGTGISFVLYAENI